MFGSDKHGDACQALAQALLGECTCSWLQADPAAEETTGRGSGIEGHRGVASIGQDNGLSGGSFTGEGSSCSTCPITQARSHMPYHICPSL